MSDGQIIIYININTEGVNNELRRLKEEASNLGKSFDNIISSFSDNLGKYSRLKLYNSL